MSLPSFFSIRLVLAGLSTVGLVRLRGHLLVSPSECRLQMVGLLQQDSTEDRDVLKQFARDEDDICWHVNRLLPLSVICWHLVLNLRMTCEFNQRSSNATANEV